MLMTLVEASQQAMLLDQTIAFVNQEMILQSELEDLYKQYMLQHNTPGPFVKKQLLLNLIWKSFF